MQGYEDVREVIRSLGLDPDVEYSNSPYSELGKRIQAIRNGLSRRLETPIARVVHAVENLVDAWNAER